MINTNYYMAEILAGAVRTGVFQERGTWQTDT